MQEVRPRHEQLLGLAVAGVVHEICGAGRGAKPREEDGGQEELKEEEEEEHKGEERVGGHPVTG